jgi:hypothetical protein
VPRHRPVEGDLLHPDHWLLVVQGSMAKQAEGDKVQRAACWLVTEVCHSPVADAAIEEHANEDLIAGLSTVARPAANVQAPVEDEPGLRAVLALSLSLLEGAVLCLDLTLTASSGIHLPRHVVLDMRQQDVPVNMM